MKPVFLLTAAMVLGTVLAVGPAVAQTVSDQAKEAERLAAGGKYAAAMAALDGAVGTLWDKSPLVCRRILWVAEKAAGFGEYNPREGNSFKAGADMLIYAEPIGFGWRRSGDIWHTDMAADLIIRGKDGKELFRKDDFGKFDIGSRARNREFMLNLSISLSGAPAGDYVAETRLRDKVTGKEGTCSLPFAIK
jgi:hypothetical protein